MTITKKQADDYADNTLDFASAFIVKHPKTIMVLWVVSLLVLAFFMRG